MTVKKVKLKIKPFELEDVDGEKMRSFETSMLTIVTTEDGESIPSMRLVIDLAADKNGSYLTLGDVL